MIHFSYGNHICYTVHHIIYIRVSTPSINAPPRMPTAPPYSSHWCSHSKYLGIFAWKLMFLRSSKHPRIWASTMMFKLTLSHPSSHPTFLTHKPESSCILQNSYSSSIQSVSAHCRRPLPPSAHAALASRPIKCDPIDGAPVMRHVLQPFYTSTHLETQQVQAELCYQDNGCYFERAHTGALPHRLHITLMTLRSCVDSPLVLKHKCSFSDLIPAYPCTWMEFSRILPQVHTLLGVVHDPSDRRSHPCTACIPS